MPLNKKFQHQPSAIASYNYTDIAEGTGIIVYYGFATETSTGFDYHLTTDSTTYSSLIETLSSAAGNIAIDHDFDLTVFNLPQIVKGTATVSFTMGGVTGAGETMTVIGTVRIRKWDGTTETEIASIVTPTITIAGVGTTTKELMTVPITIPNTQFKGGETLRVSIHVQGTRVTGAGTISVVLGHDPRNRDGTIIIPSTDDPDTITKMIAKIPFKIDV